jgi:hypothetical protein
MAHTPTYAMASVIVPMVASPLFPRQHWSWGCSMANNSDEELADLEARVAALRAAKQPTDVQRVGPSAGFASGFFGCFGVGAAIVAFVVLVIVAGMILGPSPRKIEQAAEEPATPSAASETADHAIACAKGLIAADRITRRARGATFNYPWTSEVLDPGPPSVVKCLGVTSPGGNGSVTVKVNCPDMSSSRCVKLFRLELGGKEIYQAR